MLKTFQQCSPAITHDANLLYKPEKFLSTDYFKFFNVFLSFGRFLSKIHIYFKLIFILQPTHIIKIKCLKKFILFFQPLEEDR